MKYEIPSWQGTDLNQETAKKPIEDGPLRNKNDIDVLPSAGISVGNPKPDERLTTIELLQSATPSKPRVMKDQTPAA